MGPMLKGQRAVQAGCVNIWFLVIKCKCSDKEKDLKGVENAKIACARQHFAVVSNNNVKYDVVSSIGGLKRKLFG